MSNHDCIENEEARKDNPITKPYNEALKPITKANKYIQNPNILSSSFNFHKKLEFNLASSVISNTF